MIRYSTAFPAELIDEKKRELLSRRERLTNDRDRLENEQAKVTITPDVAAMLREVGAMIRVAEPNMTFEERRQLLRILRVRIDVIDSEHVRVSGLLSPAVLTTSSR